MKEVYCYMLTLLSILVCLPGEAQKKSPAVVVSEVFHNTPLPEALEMLRKNYNLQFTYLKNQLDGCTVSATLQQEPIQSSLEIIFENTPFRFQFLENNNYLILYDKTKPLKKTPRYSITGRITDNYHQPLAGVSIAIPFLGKTTLTDHDGFYLITNLKAAEYIIRFKKEGYYHFNEIISVEKNSEYNVQLSKTSKYALNDAVINSAGEPEIPVLDRSIDLPAGVYTVDDVLRSMENKGGLSFSYNINDIPLSRPIAIQDSVQSVKALLGRLLNNTRVEYIAMENKIILRERKPKSQSFTINGTLKDKQTGENLIGATISLKGTAIAALTNDYGFYSLTVPEWDYTLLFSFIGYTTVKKEISVNANMRLDVALESSFSQLNEVTVNAQTSEQHIQNTDMSTAVIDSRALKKMPAFMGEADVIKSVVMLPGVSTVGEGAVGFNVRGGSIDQNLILLDEAPVYNSSHLLGLFSVFNADAVKDIKLYKGGMPALYGGRLSSVLDITQKEGNDKKLEGSGGLGLIFSKLTLQGPLVKNKSSFIVAARRSYADIFFKNKYLQKKFSLPIGTDAYFYDVSTKLNYIINDRNRIYLSGYFGKDNYSFGVDDEWTLLSWGNSTATLRWNHLFSDKLFSNHTAIVSNYDYNQGIASGYFGYKGNTGIINYQLKSDYTLYANVNHKIDFGMNGILYKLHPIRAVPANDSSVFVSLRLPDDNAVEAALYASDEYKISDRVTVYGGLRYSLFTNVGPGKVYRFNPDESRSASSVLDTIYYRSGDFFHSYAGLEPRISVVVLTGEKSSFKMSYNRTRQNLHLISNTVSATPVDVYKLSNPNIKPETADQVALGYFRNLREKTLEFSAEIYYKTMHNILDYRNGANLVGNELLDAEILQGNGKAYGIELTVNKKVGRLTGWTSYTYSRSIRKIETTIMRDKINNDQWYPANYDQPHKVNMAAVYQISRRISVSANFTYNTGRPASYPDGQFVYFNKVYPTYSSRNQQRIPDYHRLDISATINGRGNKWWKGSWSLSIYNAYGRKNAYSIYFKQVDNAHTTQAVKLSILGSVIPSLTYNFKFL